jgi:proteic killer suppression protein
MARSRDAIRVIRSFADQTKKDIWNGANSKAARRIPPELRPAVRRKLDQLDVVVKLEDLKVPPGNRLHSLTQDLAGYHAIRVNDQYRVLFRFEGTDADDVSCTDYH